MHTICCKTATSLELSYHSRIWNRVIGIELSESEKCSLYKHTPEQAAMHVLKRLIKVLYYKSAVHLQLLFTYHNVSFAKVDYFLYVYSFISVHLSTLSFSSLSSAFLYFYSLYIEK
ncbi:hypothetical protein NERG_00506 [Nematocida ausubeli]|uniref:Uncharacterized protein n=1 Tax=Nematocida ausubeli (strain ATCC PRA-371 / ERTm2) TaxID=1913371 RepID=H8ZA85_NEMA1|nr:hypothetical protein NERG_00506 [Nematocida ausubeli]